MTTKLALEGDNPIVMGFTGNGSRRRGVECDLRPLLRLLPRLRRSQPEACKEQLVRLQIEPLNAMLFVLVAREWNKDRTIEGHIIEVQGAPDTVLVTGLEDGEMFENNHVFFVRARMPDKDIQRRFRRLVGTNEKRQTTEDERESLPMKEITLERERDLNINQVLNRMLDRGGRRR